MAFSSQYVQNGLNDKMEILFQFLRYWGLRHKWNMCDGFMFDRRYGVNVYVRKFKGILLRQLWMMGHVRFPLSFGYSLVFMA